jgi:hypothetical protein
MTGAVMIVVVDTLVLVIVSTLVVVDEMQGFSL